jgi:glycosyltransferase involved in cell wall biosynthesis
VSEGGERELRARISELEQARKELRAQLAAEQARSEEMQRSTSWRLTAPLRGLKRLFGGEPKAGSGGLIKSAYRAMPVPWSWRLRLKDLLFRGFGPLFRHTDAYRRWEQQGGREALRGSDLWSRLGKSRSKTAPTSAPVYVPIAAEPVDPAALRAKLIAFYLPQFHPIPENDAWWGKGFTEWTNVSKALPQFDGHEQPHLPGELGFYDLRVPEVMARQVELARHYGVHAFCFHDYWFDGRRVLERPLDMFLGNPDLDFPFCICWANENWTRRWDGHERDVLLGQEHSPESDLRFIRDMAPLLRDPRYLRVDGRPLLVVYRPSLLPDAAATAGRWRAFCRAEGIGEILLAMAQFDAEDPRPFGFDAALEFPPHKLARDLPSVNAKLPGLNPAFRGFAIDYEDVVHMSIQWPVPDYDMVRGVFPGWDNEARRPQQGYLFAHRSPALYREWLSFAVEHARAYPLRGEPLVFINAWNEWAEGAFLEPDRRNGYAYLQATRDAVTGAGSAAAVAAPSSRIVVVCHDAHPHGAQYLSLHLCRELKRSSGRAVDLVLLGGGVLEEELRAQADATWELDGGGSGEAARALALHLRSSGADIAIANTTVSGLFAAELARAGIRVVGLVHELPGVIEQMRLQGAAKALATAADKIVFAGEKVREGFARYAPLAPTQAVLQPQGLYKRNRLAGDREAARAALRTRLGLPKEARIVLGVGYADARKGADLFVDAGTQLVREDPRVHLVWLGHHDASLQPQLEAAIGRAGLAAHFHFPGRDADTDPWYAGADLFALTSREDPFPTVIMEALDAGLPVVAFAGVGGFDELVEDCGRLAPAFDTKAYAWACAHLLADEAERARLAARGRERVERDFDFPKYVRFLQDLLEATPRVSVVLPNYNYARYLPQRIASIFAQTHPPFEVIVLDDGSTDDSLRVLESLSRQYPIRVISGEPNSGSVFRQWLRGAREARGELVWIAEADDLAEPGFLAALLPAFATPGVVMAATQSRQIDGEGAQLAPDYLKYVREFGATRWRAPFVAGLADELRHGMAVKNTLPNASALLFRRNALLEVLENHVEQIAGYRVAGDWLAYLLLLERGQLAFRPEALNAHRRHTSSVTLGGDARRHFEEVRRVQEWVAARHPLDADARTAAARYLEFLGGHLGLETGET